jgi:hypothetical protein
LQKADALEVVEAIPVAAKLIIMYDPDKEDLFICAFDLRLFATPE